jgi:hypothetical protein
MQRAAGCLLQLLTLQGHPSSYAASTQCSSASFNYVIAQYEAGVVPDATLNIAQVSNCGGAVTVGGTDCNSACLAGFSLGNIATGVNLLIPTNTNSTCACAVGEIITTSATNSAGAGTGILITPAPTDPNIEFSWNAATINGLSGFTMTAGTGAFTGCTISYSLSAPSSSPAANIVKPAAALVAAGVVAMLL